MRLLMLMLMIAIPCTAGDPPADLKGLDFRQWIKTHHYDGKHQKLGYKSARRMMYNRIDNKNGVVTCVYGGYEKAVPFGGSNTNPMPINAEHVVPQSFFDKREPMKSDLHHLFPTFNRFNSNRSNYPFAEIPDNQTDKWMRDDRTSSRKPTAAIDSYSEGMGRAFEPPEAQKGNVARAVFYFLTMYRGVNMSQLGDAEMFYAWHLMDPPDAVELARNEGIEEHQKNRNPYIDHPEWVLRAWPDIDVQAAKDILADLGGADTSPTPPDKSNQPKPKDTVVKMTFLAMNDVYEMMPMSDGNGGLARVATLKNQLAAQNPTFAFLAGDVISPSAIGTARMDGQRLNGRQMIDAFNGFLDFATLGNHEFDIGEAGLLARLNESKFSWIASNMWHRDMHRNFPNTVPNMIFLVGPKDNPVKVGVFSIALEVGGKKYLAQDNDQIAVARRQVQILKNEQHVDILIALTHLSLEEDKQLAARVPEIDLIMGGHEHENIQTLQGLDFTPITKADANARTVFVHNLAYNQTTQKLTIRSHLRQVDDSIPMDPETASTISKWRAIAIKSFIADDIEPDRIVTTPLKNLDGREASVRNHPTNLTDILAAGMATQAGVEGSIFNAGTVRIDDILVADKTITEYDLLRILPFGGSIFQVDIRGDLLVNALKQGMSNSGSGGYLQKGAIRQTGSGWTLNNKPIDATTVYSLAFSDYLLRGKENGLGFLNCTDENGNLAIGPCQTEGLTLVREAGEIVKALRSGLQTRFKKP